MEPRRAFVAVCQRCEWGPANSPSERGTCASCELDIWIAKTTIAAIEEIGERPTMLCLACGWEFVPGSTVVTTPAQRAEVNAKAGDDQAIDKVADAMGVTLQNIDEFKDARERTRN